MEARQYSYGTSPQASVMSRFALALAFLPLLPACADDAGLTGTDGGSPAGDGTTSVDSTDPPGMTSGSGTSASTTTTTAGTDITGSSDGPTSSSAGSGEESSGDESSSETTGGPEICASLRGEGTAAAAARIGDATPQVVASFEQVVALAPVDGSTILIADVGDTEIAVDPLDPLPAATGIANLRGVLALLDANGEYLWTHLLETNQLGGSTPFVNLTDVATDGELTSFIGVFRGSLALDGQDVTDCLNRCTLFGWAEPDGTLDGPYIIQSGAVVDAPIVNSVAPLPGGGLVMGGAACG